MKRKIGLLFITILISLSSIAQINALDSTVQTVAYWNKLDMERYKITTEKYTIKTGDTISRELYTYDVTITIKDSTSDSYVKEWHYTNFRVESENEILRKIVSLSTDYRLLIKTTELGEFKEIINWKEYKKYMSDILKKLKKEYKKAPTMIKLINQVSNTFSTKEAIESAGINEIQQYYAFHGLKYKLEENYETETTVPNIYGSEPFTAHFSFYLDEINHEENNYVMRSFQVIDSTQLTNASYDYVVKTMKTMGMPAPKREEFNNITNEIETGTRIHGTGWVIYSYQTKTIVSTNTTSIEKTIIEIQ
jgi:hypothetical protein